MDRNSKFGLLILILFATPFTFFGLFALKESLRLFLSPSPGTPFWYPLLFGILFTSVGVALILVGVLGSRLVARQRRVEQDHPGQPWLWRPDWAAGRVKSRTRSNMVTAWVLGILWNLVSFPSAWFALGDAAKRHEPAVYIVLLFPAVGLFLLWRAVAATLAFFKYGTTWFDMASVPATLGLNMKGTIEANFRHSPDHGVHVRLSCVHKRTTGSGRSRTTTEDIVWRDETDLEPGQLCTGPMGTTIPIEFHIPLNAQPTEKISASDEYLWLLEAMADVPGVDYHDVFEVPVFRTAASPASEAEEAMERPAFALPSPTVPQSFSVRISQSAEGTEFYFPAARNPGAATVTTIIAVVLTALTAVLTLYTSAPFIFGLFFGAFACLLIYGAVRQWMGTTRVLIANSLKFQSGYMGGGKTREIAFSDIDSITEKISTQQGDATGTAYYDIILRTRSGESLTLGTMLRNKREVEYLVSELQKLTGLRARAGSGTTVPS